VPISKRILSASPLILAASAVKSANLCADYLFKNELFRAIPALVVLTRTLSGVEAEAAGRSAPGEAGIAWTASPGEAATA
jgi:hypothetical protein